MTALALRLLLGAISAPAAYVTPPHILTHRDLVELYRECLEEHELTEDENDGECEGP